MKGDTYKENEEKGKVMQYHEIQKDAVVESNTVIISVAIFFNYCPILATWCT